MVDGQQYNLGMYKKNRKLISYFKNKSVALVGPASHLHGSSLGDYIDSFDIVARVGDQYFSFDDPIRCDIGKRTDVIFNGFNHHGIEIAESNLWFFDSFVDYIIVSSGQGGEESIRKFKELSKILKKKNTIAHVPNGEYISNLSESIGTHCNSGLGAIKIILEYGVTELFVTGFSFYNMGKFGKIYYDQYYETQIIDENIRDSEDLSFFNETHNQLKHIEEFKRIIDLDPRITMDEYLEKNFKG